MSRQIIRNALQTPDGTIIESTFRHDFVEYTDKNGKTYMVDGGLDYVRGSAHEDQVSLVEYLNNDHAHNRTFMKWGTYGKNGDQSLQRKPLATLSNNHIDAILDTQTHIPAWLRTLFLKEQEFRILNHIRIED